MRVVFDTNTVLSALLFGGVSRWLVAHWQSGAVIPLLSHATAREFLRVLAYPKFRLSTVEIEILASRYLPFGERCEWERLEVDAPQCRDAHDQAFVDLAIAGQADVLVTGDNDLLDLQGVTPFLIETPSAYRLRFPSSLV